MTRLACFDCGLPIDRGPFNSIEQAAEAHNLVCLGRHSFGPGDGPENPAPPFDHEGDIGDGTSSASPSVPSPTGRTTITIPPIGVYLASITRRYADSDTRPVGGLIYNVTASTDAIIVSLVDVHRGQIRYHNLALEDCQQGQSGMYVNQRAVRSIVVELARDEARQDRPGIHDMARRALMPLIANPN